MADLSSVPGSQNLHLMSDEELHAVIALWSTERDQAVGLHDQPSVNDVAEGLDIPVSDVERLLQRIRTYQPVVIEGELSENYEAQKAQNQVIAVKSPHIEEELISFSAIPFQDTDQDERDYAFFWKLLVASLIAFLCLLLFATVVKSTGTLPQ